ncbi:hypothetical protein GJW-30_1_02354 [Variibacter gotjawalensis]|uniref:DUF883 domain-containing protein n=1 Tax=Variibacter gotjawalensis TaxID=1333996 RepID=A0A0S3PVA0_9BRAD|nr:hypothetical protein [Variibacter gotjawalensis]NIK50147.1 ElaB/YqjD/DUF883 family membrane-anchored ribosome-binding protein [Variibacter gotjawalensis]BAT59820.1 hypothetical protein GJW-30_1_02354 [Variibacter gotjawalensis]
MSNVESTTSARRKRTPAKRKTARRTTRRAAPKRNISELERIIAGLESRINELTSSSNIRQKVTGATDQVGDLVSDVVHRASAQVGNYVAESISGVAGKVRDGATSVTGVAKSGTNAMARIGTELEKRPMMTVAIALGIGFLAGLAGRRDAA